MVFSYPITRHYLLIQSSRPNLISLRKKLVFVNRYAIPLKNFFFFLLKLKTKFFFIEITTPPQFKRISTHIMSTKGKGKTKNGEVIPMQKRKNCHVSRQINQRNVNKNVEKSCPVVKTGKLCIEVTPASKIAFISETLCIGCGICVKSVHLML